MNSSSIDKATLNNVKTNLISVLASIPLILFIITPIFILLLSFISVMLNKNINIYLTEYPTLVFYTNCYATLIGLLVIILFIIKNIKNKNFIKENLPLIFFSPLIILIIISSIVNDTILTIDHYRNESLFSFVIYFCIYYFCASMISNRKLKSFLIYLFMAISLIIASCVLIDFYIIPLEIFMCRQGVNAIFHNINHYGYYLIFAITLSSTLFILNKNKSIKLFCATTFIINVITLILNDTFGAWLACLVGIIFSMVVIFLKEHKFLKITLIPLISFIAISFIMNIWYGNTLSNFIYLFNDIFNISNNTADAKDAGSGRWKIWLYTINSINERPLLGFGVEGISEKLSTFTNNSRPHNEYLQYAVFFGIPAAIMYIGGIFMVFLNAWRKRKLLDIYSVTALISAFSYAVSALFGVTMYYTAPFFFIFLGLSFNLEKDSNI